MTEPDEPAAPARRLSTRTIVIIAAIALVVLAGAGVGIYFLTKGSDTPAAGPSSNQSGAPAGAGQAPAGSTTGTSGAQAPSGGGGSGPQASDVNGAKVVADRVVTAMNTHDAEARKKISCDPNSVADVDNLPAEVRAEVVSVPELTGDSATVELKLTIGDTSTTTLLPLRKENGTWCAD